MAREMVAMAQVVGYCSNAKAECPHLDQSCLHRGCRWPKSMARLGSEEEVASIQSISLDRTVAVLFAAAGFAAAEVEGMKRAVGSNT